MTFSYTATNNGIPELMGTKRVVSGTFTCESGDTGGDIDTGLNRVDWFSIQETGGSASTKASTVNETMPYEGSTVTIVTKDGQSGIWRAEGK